MIRIIFTGAQGTGKTTILNRFNEQGYHTITEVVRKLSQKGIKINELGNSDGQKVIFDTYTKLLSDPISYISDRGLTDVVAYSMSLNKHGKITDEEMDREYKALDEFIKKNKNVVYIYFPIEFDVVDDGVRSTDEEYRHEIDDNIRHLLTRFDIPYIKVSGSVEERTNIVKNVEKLLMMTMTE